MTSEVIQEHLIQIGFLQNVISDYLFDNPKTLIFWPLSQNHISRDDQIYLLDHENNCFQAKESESDVPG